MAIPHYRLDDRGFDDLVKDMIARISAHTPEWTNPQVGDPGRTLIDLFAWLGDTLLYRINLLPERQRLEFLRLLHVQMRPARAALGLVVMTPSDSRAAKPVAIPPYTGVTGSVPFETTDNINALPFEGIPYVKRKPTASELDQLGTLIADLEQVYGLSPESSDPYVATRLFTKLPLDPDGFDLASSTIDRCLWFALAALNNESLREASASFEPDDAGPVILNIGFKPRETVPQFGEAVYTAAPLPSLWRWEMPSRQVNEQGESLYIPLRVEKDTTDGFTKAGIIRLFLPSPAQVGLPGYGLPPNSVDDDPLAGTGDRPPRIDDQAIAQRLVTWIRLRPNFEVESFAPVWMGINAVTVDQHTSLRNVIVGTSSGLPRQQLQLPVSSIERETAHIEVEEPGIGYRRWSDREIVDDNASARRLAGYAEIPLHAAGRDDPVFDLDYESGLLTFGDDIRGRIPGEGMRIRAVLLRSGGGAKGNIPAGNLSGCNFPDIKVVQPVAAWGGVDKETLEEAEQRIPSELRHRYRAVTEDDYKEVACLAPGIALGRVEVLPKFKPQQRLFGVTGIVSVMVLPQNGTFRPPNPRPDRAMLSGIHAFLDKKRGIGVELYVIGCEYVPFGVSVAVTVRDGQAHDTVLRNVALALRKYAWPLPPGGAHMAGWPLGTPVIDEELKVIVARVKGIATVEEVRLFVKNPVNGLWDSAPLAGVFLEKWQLPELLTVAVVAGESAPVTLNGMGEGDIPLGTGLLDAAGGKKGSIPIPVIPEMCR